MRRKILLPVQDDVASLLTSLPLYTKAMGIELKSIVPWGRNLEEYMRMFDLSRKDLALQVLDCGGGPASFNAELTRMGGRIISADPLYGFARSDIKHRIKETRDEIMGQLKDHLEDYVWTTHKAPDDLERVRMEAMGIFLDDYRTDPAEGEAGPGQNRYIDASLPRLPFKDNSFDLALCSHLLFTYSGKLSLEFHYESIRELCRVARQARVFPLLDLGGEPSGHLSPLKAMLAEDGYEVHEQQVDYEFQRGGNVMLRISRA